MTTKIHFINFVFYIAFIIITCTFTTNSLAQTKMGASGLPIPRFVSLKANSVNMRVGPGTSYNVSWLYTRAAIPMEIIQEYENWRLVRDFNGTEGWIFHSLLSGKRSAITTPWMRDKTPVSYISLYHRATQNSSIKAKIEPGVITKVLQCNGKWCEIDANKINGWVLQNQLWGVYPDEAFN